MWAKASEMTPLKTKSNHQGQRNMVPILQHHCPREGRLLLVTAHDKVQVAEVPLELSTPKHSEQITLLSFTCR